MALWETLVIALALASGVISITILLVWLLLRHRATAQNAKDTAGKASSSSSVQQEDEEQQSNLTVVSTPPRPDHQDQNLLVSLESFEKQDEQAEQEADPIVAPGQHSLACSASTTTLDPEESFPGYSFQQVEEGTVEFTKSDNCCCSIVVAVGNEVIL